MAAAPLIETERLRLRGHTSADFASSFAMWSDPIVTRFIGGTPSTEQQAWSRLVFHRGHWPLVGYGGWVVEDKISGIFLGECGFADYHRDIIASMRGVPEIGWVFAAHAHGQGYATEAVRAAIAWGDANFATPRTVCLIDCENIASIGVARKSGYAEFARIDFFDRPAICFERYAAAPVSGRSR